MALSFEFGGRRGSVPDSRADSPGTGESLVGEKASTRPTSLLFFCHSWLPTQVTGTSLTQMETVSAGTGTARSWDELAQDWRRAGSRSEYGPQVTPPTPPSPAPYPPPPARHSA